MLIVFGLSNRSTKFPQVSVDEEKFDADGREAYDGDGAEDEDESALLFIISSETNDITSTACISNSAIALLIASAGIPASTL